MKKMTVFFLLAVSLLEAQELKKTADIDYVGDGNPKQMLDLYLPEKTEMPVPVIVWIHGGAWRAGSKDNVGMALQQARSLGGCAVVSVGYRLTQEAQWPAQIT